MLVVCLIEEHVFAIAAFCRPFFEDTLLVYAVFSAEPLPVYGTHFAHRLDFIGGDVGRGGGIRTLVAALTQLERDYLARHGETIKRDSRSECRRPREQDPYETVVCKTETKLQQRRIRRVFNVFNGLNDEGGGQKTGRVC